MKKLLLNLSPPDCTLSSVTSPPLSQGKVMRNRRLIRRVGLYHPVIQAMMDRAAQE